MKRRILIPLLIVTCGALVAFAGQSSTPSMTKTGQKTAHNTGKWRSLFDGKSLAGWRGFHQKEPGKGWVAEGGMIKLTSRPEGSAGEPNGDLITVDQFENFEFEIEWRLGKGGNSGIKYLVSEDLPKTGRSGVSFEYQVLDDENHPDAKMGIAGNRTVGALYDLIPPSGSKKVKPVGQFNLTRIVKRGSHIEHWLNGEKVVEFEQGSDDLKARIAASKFKTTAGFGEAKRGHILLQDHSDGVWFKNIKIREL
ncbi:MAG: DUF1080 domain-containing protein [Acidobacteriota bacterium]